jgi:formiminotetrahydrofolate cyclodeaminase
MFTKDYFNRQQYNNKIFDLIKDNIVISNVKDTLKELIDTYDQQRFGQIICNYICPDYRDSEQSIESKAIMDALFNNVKCDPFYEESFETYNRFKRDNEKD